MWPIFILDHEHDMATQLESSRALVVVQGAKVTSEAVVPVMLL